MSFIKKIEIKSLFGQYDLVWNLNPDVNILAGINGSGKSTFLRCVASLLADDKVFPLDNHSFEEIQITTDNGGKGTYRYVPYSADKWKKLQQLLLSNYDEKKYRINVETLKKREVNLNESSPPLVLYPNADDGLKVFREETHITHICTFDVLLPHSVEQEEGITELDKLLSSMQRPYITYQRNLALKALVISQKKGNDGNAEIQKLYENYEKFLDTLDSFFKGTNKKINRRPSEKDEITFLAGDKELSVYQLSAGEKQLLLIFLTLLLHDKKPAVFLMDEPEISLHPDWQEKLISSIRGLNPNAQLIIATHSPAIIMNGWLDKVFNIRDLYKK
jgi:predicted ATPase